MKAPQYLTLLAAITMTAIIYFLPRVVLENNSKKQDTTGVAQASNFSNTKKSTENLEHEEDMHDHAPLMDRQAEEEVGQLRQKFNSAENKKKKAIFAANLAERFESVGRFDSAAGYRKLVVEIEPTIANKYKAGDAYLNAQGTTLNVELGRKYAEEARNYFSEVYLQDPRQLNAKTKMALTYIGSETPMKGIALLKEVLDADHNNKEALYQMGVLSLQSGQLNKAISRFSELLKLYPEFYQARFYYAVALKEKGKTEDAKKEFLLVQKQNPDPAVQATVQDYLDDLRQQP